MTFIHVSVPDLLNYHPGTLDRGSALEVSASAWEGMGTSRWTGLGLPPQPGLGIVRNSMSQSRQWYKK